MAIKCKSDLCLYNDSLECTKKSISLDEDACCEEYEASDNDDDD